MANYAGKLRMQGVDMDEIVPLRVNLFKCFAAPLREDEAAGEIVFECCVGVASGNIVTSTIMELLIFPAIYFIWRSRQLLRREPAQKKQTVLQELRS